MIPLFVNESAFMSINQVVPFSDNLTGRMVSSSTCSLAICRRERFCINRL